MNERAVRALSAAALAGFLGTSWYSYAPTQWPDVLDWKTLVATSHPCGPLGLVAARAMIGLLGPFLAALVPLALLVVGMGAAAAWPRRRVAKLLARLGLVGAFGGAIAELVVGPGSGGVVGLGAVRSFTGLLGRIGTLILLAAVGGFVLLRLATPLLRPLWAHVGEARDVVGDVSRMAWARALRGLRSLRDSLWQPDPDEPERETARPVRRPATRETPQPTAAPTASASRDGIPETPRIRDVRRTIQPRVVEAPRDLAVDADEPRVRTLAGASYQLPELELLENPPVSTDAAVSDEALLELSKILEEKLADFGIGGRVSEVQPGPVITTYEFEPAPGIKVSQVTSRVDDLAMALRARAIRMVAPIPGKAAIGIEIPNATPQRVGLREIMESWAPDLHVGPLGLALGKTVAGDPFFADLASMPHLLVAGATGSGKSVCINVLLCSLLLRHDPNEVKLLLVDPKMLELNAYHDIPHLLHPVVTDPKEAYRALHWLTLEMERRYRELAKAGVRNIGGYNKKIAAGAIVDDEGRPKESLPYVVVVVDELADLMIQVGGEIETPIARLAQMARAVGIHLVLATQRPSVDVLTGVIKANFPSRIAFQVSSRVDSRTILDTNGAEMLLGRGDMLFLPGGRPTPIRLHGAFVSVEECERIAAHWRAFGAGPGRLDLDEARPGSAGADSGDDELFDAARRLVVASGVGSVSYLQRRLKVGYSRAARIMDMLEDAGVVGPAVGSKAREVLERPEDLPEPVE